MIYYIRDEEGSLIGLKYNDTIYYYIKNLQEDIIGITDSYYNEVCRYEYDSFGRIIAIKDNNGNIIKDESHIGIINPYRYRSYYYDKETKLYYLNSRYYNPEWGRFLNIDSISAEIGNLMSHNMYKYANNNPINFNDNDGSWPTWVKKVAIGVGAIVVGGIIAVATGGAFLPAIAAGAKIALTIGAVSAVTKGTTKAIQSASKGNSAKTVAKEAAKAAGNGFASGFEVGGVVSAISAASNIGSHSDGIKIGETSKDNYGRVTIGYGAINKDGKPNGMTIINYANKKGKSKFRVDIDPTNMVHMHYGKTNSAMRKHRTLITDIIFGVISGL